jgi:putative hydrolase of the HAD superfamily
MIRTVIFDLDDTLYDEIDFCRSGFHAAAQHIAALSDAPSADEVFALLWKHFTTGDGGSTFNLALADLGIPDDGRLIGRLVEIYRTHTPALALPPESRAVLEDLKGRYTLGLLTDGFLPTQRLKVQALGIEPYFKAIMYTEELGREFWKPSPRGFERLLEMLEARPEQAVYVADNEIKDFIAPNRLGLLTVQLRRSSGLYRQPAPAPDTAPKVRIERIGDLARILGSWQAPKSATDKNEGRKARR